MAGGEEEGGFERFSNVTGSVLKTPSSSVFVTNNTFAVKVFNLR